MEKKSMQMIAIAIVAIFVIAAVTVVITNNGDDDDEGKITITQNDGKKVKVSVPVEKMCVVNTNAAEFATLLGVSDRVVGVSKTMIDVPDESWWAERTNIGTYKEPNGDKILETGAKLIIGQCSAMSISNVEALESQGITVLLLDMYGYETQVDDLRQFAKLFPDTNAAEIAEEYGAFLSNVKDTVKSKTSTIADSDKKSFLATMGMEASSKYYTVNSELSQLLTDICGMKNSIAGLVDSKSSSANVGEDSIVKEFNTNGIDLFILRNSSDYDKASADLDRFISNHPVMNSEGMFDKMDLVKTIDTRLLSGPRCFVSMVFFAGLANPELELGMTVESIIQDYNAQFGVDYSTEKLFYTA